jgi:hypothetical protein
VGDPRGTLALRADQHDLADLERLCEIEDAALLTTATPPLDEPRR